MIVPTFFTKYQTIIMTHQIKLRLNLLLPFIGRFTSQKVQLQNFHKWRIWGISTRYHSTIQHQIIMQESSVQKHIHMVDAKC